MIEAAVFDFDGLILDTEWPEYQSISETFAEHGHDFPLEGWVHIVGTTSSPSWLDLLEERVGTPIDREAVRTRRVERHHALIAERDVLPGVVERLEEARALGVPVAVASSSEMLRTRSSSRYIAIARDSLELPNSGRVNRLSARSTSEM